MIFLYVCLFIVALAVSFVNIYFAKIDTPTTMEIFKAAIYMLPVQFIVGLAYAFYYSEGIKTMSYLALNLSSYPLLLMFGIAVHFIFFKNHTFTIYEILGIVFTLIGLGFFLFNKVYVSGGV